MFSASGSPSHCALPTIRQFGYDGGKPLGCRKTQIHFLVGRCQIPGIEFVSMNLSVILVIIQVDMGRSLG